MSYSNYDTKVSEKPVEVGLDLEIVSGEMEKSTQEVRHLFGVCSVSTNRSQKKKVIELK